MKYNKLTPEEERDITERCYERFKKISKLQKEFCSREAYSAYIKAKWVGMIKD